MKVNIAADKSAEEIVSDVLISAGAQGVSIEGDEKACANEIQPWDYLDEGILERTPYCVCAYFPCDGTEQEKLRAIRCKLKDIRQMNLDIPLGTLAVSTAVIDEQDWENAWKAYFKPVKVSNFVVIKPTWEEYHAGDGEVVIELDPGMAFGTGNHETTRLCVNLMEEYVEKGMYVIDVGCGSGILSIAAAKFGVQKVAALDFDSVAVEVTKQNAAANGCKDVIKVRQSDLLTALNPEPKADMIVANIIADVILKLSGSVASYLKKNGMLLCSGIIDSRLDEVVAALEAQKFRIIHISSDGEWRAIACKYKG